MDAKITALDALTAPIATDVLAIVDDPGGTPITKKITLVNLGLIDGWIHAVGTWTYASATTITVPSGAAAIYQKGDKFKLTANSVVLQGYIITVADTLLTVVGDALTNHTFTLNYYSHASNPIGFPQWFDWTPVWDSNGAMTYSSVTGTTIFCINGQAVSIIIKVAGTTASTAATGIRATPPVPINTDNSCGASWVNDGGYKAGAFNIGGADNIICYNSTLASWGIGSGKSIRFNAVYQMA